MRESYIFFQKYECFSIFILLYFYIYTVSFLFSNLKYLHCQLLQKIMDLNITSVQPTTLLDLGYGAIKLMHLYTCYKINTNHINTIKITN